MGLFVVKKNKSKFFHSIKSSWRVCAWRWTLGMEDFDLNMKRLSKCVLSAAKFLLNAALVWPIVSLVSTSICSVDLMLDSTILI